MRLREVLPYAFYAASALVSILLRMAAPENVQSYVIWTLGEFAGVSWGEAAILAPALMVGLMMAAVAVKPLNALLLGETYARSMGVAVERNRIWLIACGNGSVNAGTSSFGTQSARSDKKSSMLG